MKNPKYKGTWSPPMIDNPAYTVLFFIPHHVLFFFFTKTLSVCVSVSLNIGKKTEKDNNLVHALYASHEDRTFRAEFIKHLGVKVVACVVQHLEICYTYSSV